MDATAWAGEWGHTALPWMHADEFPGPACYCGLRGCIETWISGTGLEDDYERATKTRLKGKRNHRALRGRRSGGGSQPGALRGSPDAQPLANREHLDPDVNCSWRGCSQSAAGCIEMCRSG